MGFGPLNLRLPLLGVDILARLHCRNLGTDLDPKSALNTSGMVTVYCKCKTEVGCSSKSINPKLNPYTRSESKKNNQRLTEPGTLGKSSRSGANCAGKLRHKAADNLATKELNTENLKGPGHR